MDSRQAMNDHSVTAYWARYVAGKAGTYEQYQRGVDLLFERDHDGKPFRLETCASIGFEGLWRTVNE